MQTIGHLSWLVITLYFFLLVSIDHSSAGSNHEINKELRFIHREIGLLRDENHHQNMEIALLKERIRNSEDSDDQRIIGNSRLSDDNHRKKRPVRLLPPHILFGERKNETELQKQMNRRRYEQPTNCSDLSLLGYTLNGFYLVKSNESSTKGNSTNQHDIKLDTVFCAFKQPEGTFNPFLVEKRIISRRETKPSSGKLLYFHATRKTELKVNRNSQFFTIKFDKVNVNLDKAFNAITDTFSVQKSGVYLFIFRGTVTFPQEFVSNGGILGWIYYAKNGKMMGQNSVSLANNHLNKSTIVELDKVIKLNREDKIVVGSQFDLSIKAQMVLANSTSFAVYLLEE